MSISRYIVVAVVRYPYACSRLPVRRSHGVIFMGARRAEEGHDAVAHDLVDRALVAVDGLHHAFEDGIEELARLLGIAVGEEDRDLLALAFEVRIFSGRCLGV